MSIFPPECVWGWVGEGGNGIGTRGIRLQTNPKPRELGRVHKPWGKKLGTVKAPNIAHLSLLTSVGYKQKETKLKKCAQPNKVIIIYHLHRVQNEK